MQLQDIFITTLLLKRREPSRVPRARLEMVLAAWDRGDGVPGTLQRVPWGCDHPGSAGCASRPPPAGREPAQKLEGTAGDRQVQDRLPQVAAGCLADPRGFLTSRAGLLRTAAQGSVHPSELGAEGL